MKTICLYFQIHQPLRLKKYRFFNMGVDTNYLDEHLNRTTAQKVAGSCYIPMNDLLLSLIERHNGALRVSFSISGLAVEQMKQYAPEALESFRRLAATGCVEFIAETYSHSLSTITSPDEFREEVYRDMAMIEREFGQKPTTFRNTEMIYSDSIGEMVSQLGFTAMITEGAKHILGWKSPNYLYANAINPRLKLLLRNARLSDDLRYRFSDRTWNEWPLTADKYLSWLTSDRNPGDMVNLFLDYETFGYHQSADTGIFDFFGRFVDLALSEGLVFDTPHHIIERFQPVSVLHIPYAISWTDEERDLTAWFGNELQNEAISKLYAQRDKVYAIGDEGLMHVWRFMQTSNHFYYMSTKWFSDNTVANVNPYGSPYEAFINYMNVLSDFIRQLDERVQN